MELFDRFINPLKINKQKITEKYSGRFGKKRLIKLFGQIILGFFVLIILLFIWYSKDLPTPGKIKALQPIESTNIKDRNGKALYDVSSDVKRTIIESKDIPNDVKNATVSAEDKDFYKEFGFSITGILRSLYNDITGKTGYIAGGSTITQQYVKNALLTNDKTITRKLKELILTIEVEIMFNKDQILTLYLNQIPYGSNAYGIQAASQNYFNKDAKDLTLTESATLAALPKAPTYYSPYGSHPDMLKIRRDYILDRMAILKYIDQKTADDAKSQKVSVVPRHDNISAPHFVFYVKDKLIDMFGEQMVDEGGLRVTTTLDLDKQRKAEEIVATNAANKLKKYNASNASLVHIDPKTGQIIAMVGSKDFFDTESDGQVNVTIADRQPGSSFKPLVYATAFMGKYNPSYTLWDVPTDFGKYTPQNYDGATHGPMSIRQSLSNSLNIPAVKMLYLTGIDKVLDQVHKMGITTLNDPSRYGLSLVLGGGEVKLLDLTTAYGVFANSGTLHDTTAILKVEDKNGKILYEYKDNKNKKEVLNPQIAYEISDILSDNGARQMVFGFTNQLQFTSQKVAVKTGTTQENRDGWTVGYTPSAAVGVWVGNNDNSKMKSGADGSVVAAPIWHAYMQSLFDSGLAKEDFNKPDGIRIVTVDKYSNKLPTDQSPQLITDIFADWQVPKDNDNIHLKIDLCKICNSEKLATPLCPASQIETRTYTNLHSEVPANPNWENSVLDWAKNNGVSIGNPPTEKCNLDAQLPTITLTQPINNQIVSGNFSMLANASSANGIKYVEFFIDDISIGQISAEPFTMQYNASSLSDGAHSLSAKITDNSDLTDQKTVSIIVNKDLTPPGPVSSAILSPSTSSIKATWKNPADPDLAKIDIYVSSISGQLGNVQPNEILATPNSNGAYTIANLTSNQIYYITIRPVDNAGNENKTITQFSSTPL
jgi:1A family penicillin-binding protein